MIKMDATTQDKKVEEMIENINKLNEDIKSLREAYDEIKKGQQSIEDLLTKIEEKCAE